ncbi:MAG: hypothetical protein ABJF10_22240 [Chthoniobacter sp.]|uniref:hypothetical protein n=1 Tax=Chthoniobacter sp. TaxID=2510640 RepID=UPI0032AC3A82
MKTLHLLLPVLTFSLAASLHAESVAFQGKVAPEAGQVSKSLFWVADTRKMDAFLAAFQPADLRDGAYAGEILPDTRVAWRDYAGEATFLAGRGQQAEAAAKLAQMLKLAAVYRAFGGLQNVVQGEEIRHLAGLTAEKLGKAVTALIKSPYLEKDASDSLVAIEAQVGDEKSGVTSSFWRHLEMGAVETHYRLTGDGVALAAVQ